MRTFNPSAWGWRGAKIDKSWELSSPTSQSDKPQVQWEVCLKTIKLTKTEENKYPLFFTGLCMHAYRYMYSHTHVHYTPHTQLKSLTERCEKNPRASENETKSFEIT